MSTQKEKKKSSKKVWIVLAVVVVLFVALVAWINSLPEPEEETTTSAPSTSASQEAEEYLKKIKEKLPGAIGENNETIKSVKLKNKALTVSVDISKADPSPLTYEMLAESRAGSITDAILDLEEYFDLWETITIDFGKIGKVKATKSDVEKNEYGLSYFPEEKLTLTGSSTEPATTKSSTTAVPLENQNALSAALSYLNFSAFSEKGLKEQLQYEGYSDKACNYAVKHCGADWTEQASKAAQSYLQTSSFSAKGLKEQLQYEGYSNEACEKAVANCGADWNEQAAKAAQSYLQTSSFSANGLKEQLEFDGFTAEQAAYGVKAAGY